MVEWALYGHHTNRLGTKRDLPYDPIAKTVSGIPLQRLMQDCLIYMETADSTFKSAIGNNNYIKARDLKPDDRRPRDLMRKCYSMVEWGRFLAETNLINYRRNKNTSPNYLRGHWVGIVRSREAELPVPITDSRPWYDKV